MLVHVFHYTEREGENSMSMDCKGMAFFPNANFMLQNPNHDQDPLHHLHSTSSPHLLTSWFPQDHHGQCSPSLSLSLPPSLIFTISAGTASTTTLLGKRSMSFMGFEHQEPGNAGDDELSSEDLDGGPYSAQAGLLGEKKKRLSIEQVRTLEKSFEMHGNKLEPERKLQLAKAVGLQPRQVAIWFQNRRARWKTKQLEKEYDILKRQFDSVKANNDALYSKNRKLHAEIMALKGRDHPIRELMINLNKESEGSGSNRSSENNSDLKLNFSPSRMTPYSIPEHEHDTLHHPTPMSRQLFPMPSGLTNVFPNIDANSGFWPWLDQHQHLNN